MRIPYISVLAAGALALSSGSFGASDTNRDARGVQHGLSFGQHKR